MGRWSGRAAWRRPMLAVLLGVQVVLLALLVWLALGDGQTAPTRLAGDAAAGIATPVTMEGGLAVAEQTARRWQANAALVSATMRVQWPSGSVPATEAVSPFGWIDYVFRGGGELLSVTMDRRTGVVLRQRTTDHDVASGPPITTYPFSSEVAVLTAELVSGNAYRARCPERRSVTLVGLTRAGGSDRREVWVVTYGDEGRPGKIEVLVKIDANTGAVVDNVVEDGGCA